MSYYQSIAAQLRRHIAPSSGRSVCKGVEPINFSLTPIFHCGRAATQAHGARWVNILLSNVKRSISGTYHAFDQRKYARRYLGEAAWRFNRRCDLPSMLPQLLHAMILCSAIPEPVVRQASNFLG